MLEKNLNIEHEDKHIEYEAHMGFLKGNDTANLIEKDFYSLEAILYIGDGMQCSYTNCQSKADAEVAIVMNKIELFTMNLCFFHYFGGCIIEQFLAFFKKKSSREVKRLIPKIEIRFKRMLP